MKKDDLANLGTEADHRIRTSKQRNDHKARRDKVAAARKHILEGGYTVNSAKVEQLLAEQSWTPTEVR